MNAVEKHFNRNAGKHNTTENISTPQHASTLKTNVIRINSIHHEVQQSLTQLCRNCGKQWPHKHGQKNCPAFNKRCGNCNKWHHFASVCRSQRKKQQDNLQIHRPSKPNSMGRSELMNHHYQQRNNCSRCKLHTHRIWTKRDETIKLQVPQSFKNRLLKIEENIKDLKLLIEKISADREKVINERTPFKNIGNAGKTKTQNTHGVTVTKQRAHLPDERETTININKNQKTDQQEQKPTEERKATTNENHKENCMDEPKNPKKKRKKKKKTENEEFVPTVP